MLGFFAKEKTRKAEFAIAKLHQTDWWRNLLLVKSPVPDGAEYFVVYDHLSGPDGSTWNLDVHSEEPTVVPLGGTSPAAASPESESRCSRWDWTRSSSSRRIRQSRR